MRVIEIGKKRKKIGDEKNNFVHIALDCSSSMSGSKIDKAKKGVLNFAKSAIKEARPVGVVIFKSYAKQICDFTRDLEEIASSLRSAVAYGTTKMSEVISLAGKKLKNKEGSRTLVIITDGRPNSEKETLKEADKVKGEGITIITIGTDDAEKDFLKRLSSEELNIMTSNEKLEKDIENSKNMLPELR